MNSSNLVGVFGGSFDPPHLGHAEVAKSFWENFPNAQELLIVPNHTSPWKQNKKTAPELILDLVRVQFQSFPNTKIWDWEIKRETPSYTEETILELLKVQSGAELALLIGEDNYSEFHKWKNWENILDKVHYLLVFRRFSESIPQNRNLQIFQNKIVFLRNRIIEAASVNLREELPKCILNNRKPIALSDEVWDIILKNRSYT
ncbi:nicotinate-nicotinamide nucleotide adenylyltransferase [Leptospira hartskeerlii]|uniref:Probable nicotinate-nucleotide adenylyltransferase n=1 Tax=Leptospira hartskeerlii TaxID=2023177 RepID=A0A2M9XCF5_9LEPT|nr:nicotinate-nicotinamide nucleotide adenylyltransferase [Leptospira hartskeerlii]PJZ25377.1 nicotinate-nicotinamide nucleotide adenylyltransferase [Leptospira hartskeerlii]PJZ32643.1 nicotinate-nicotinamide nucleotide adenylyltransferase [Leptospira hartskeerlii]